MKTLSDLSEKEQSEFGEKLGNALNIKKVGSLWQLNSGSKTDLGLCRTFERIVSEIQDGDLTLQGW